MVRNKGRKGRKEEKEGRKKGRTVRRDEFMANDRPKKEGRNG